MTARRDDIVTFHKRKSGGHYARVMGTLHRHTKTEKAGDAALGMLARIWSYCADMGRHVLSERDLSVIMVRDKNGPRKLKALLDARLLDRVEGGYSPHDWFDHNPGIAPDGEAKASGTRVDGEGNVTGNVTGNVSKPPERKQRLTTTLSDSGLRTQESLRETHRSGLCVASEESSGMSFPTKVQTRFRKFYLDRFGSDPAMGGKSVGGFATRLANTAEARGEDPFEMLDETLDAWAGAGRPGLERSTPYAAFVARFDALIEAPHKTGLSPLALAAIARNQESDDD